MSKKRTQRIVRPTEAQIIAIFSPLDSIFNQLLNEGTICTDQDDEPIFKDREGVWHATVPALNGWIELWEILAEKGRFKLDLGPLRRLTDTLSSGSEVHEDDAIKAKNVINDCRRLFRGMDANYVAAQSAIQQVRHSKEQE